MANSPLLDVDITLALGATVLAPKLRIETSGITAVFGPSGSGKTSLINAIAGLLRPVRGYIRFGELSFYDREQRIDVPAEQRHIGYVFQDGRLFPHLTVAGNLEYGRRRRGNTGAGVALQEVVNLLDIGALLTRRPIHLSGGERQRVALGRAILSNPRLLLLDEPLSSLDSARKDEIVPYLHALRARFDLPMLLVTHSVDEVLRLADNLVLLRQGAVVGSGAVRDVLSQPSAVTDGFAQGTLLDARVADWAAGIATLNVGDTSLRMPLAARPVGARVRLWIAAEDVVFASAASAVSARMDPLSITIDTVSALPDGTAMVRGQFGRGDQTSIVATVMAHSEVAPLLLPGSQWLAYVRAVVLD